MVADKERPRKPKRPRLYDTFRDAKGTHWKIQGLPAQVGPKGEKFEPLQPVEAWWDREPKKLSDEQLIIRQVNEDTRADVIQLSLSQAYALIAVLNDAVEKA